MTAPWATVWFYNSTSGAVISEPAFGDTIQSHLPGWHGPFGTKQEALDYYTQNKAANPSWKAPTGLAGNVENTVNAANPLNWVASITGISGTNLVIRSLKVIIGGTLLLVGIVHLAGIDSGTVATLARKVPVPV
jgi:hypothetical protein